MLECTCECKKLCATFGFIVMVTCTVSLFLRLDVAFILVPDPSCLGTPAIDYPRYLWS